VAGVGGGSVAVDRGDPNDRRVAHRRGSQIQKRIVVGPLPLHAAEAEALGGEAARDAVGAVAPEAAELLGLVEIESHRRVFGIELERAEAERGEVGGLVHLDHGSGRLMHELDGEQQVLARGVQHRDIPFEARVDRAEELEGRGDRLDERRVAPGLRDAFEPNVTLLAEPVERLVPKRDPIRRRGLRKSLLNLARHRWIVECGMPVERAREHVTGVILAAGGSQRLGRPKQLLPYGDTTLLDHALGTARACAFDQIVCVLGAGGDAIRAAVDLRGVNVVSNDDFGTGCSSSIAVALGAVGPRADVLVLLLADQPGVTPATVATLLAGRGDAPLAACAYEDGRGHPLAFARDAFAELGALHGDKGVWKLLDRRAAEVVDVPVGGQIPLDVDTWEDYDRLIAETGTSA